MKKSIFRSDHASNYLSLKGILHPAPYTLHPTPYTLRTTGRNLLYATLNTTPYTHHSTKPITVKPPSSSISEVLVVYNSVGTPEPNPAAYAADALRLSLCGGYRACRITPFRLSLALEE